MRRAQPESELQQAIVKHLGARGYHAVHVPNGSKLSGTGEQRQRTGARLKREGLKAGFPDLLVYGHSGRIGHIEVKAPKGNVSQAQEDVAAWLVGWGHNYALCRSIADVDAALADWGWA